MFVGYHEVRDAEALAFHMNILGNLLHAADEQVMEQALQTLEEWMTSEFAKLMDQLETLTAQTAASTQSFDHTQQRLQQQEQQIERLIETTARLTEQLARHEQTQQQLLSLIEQPPASGQNVG